MAAKTHSVDTCTRTRGGEYIIRLINPPGTARSFAKTLPLLDAARRQHDLYAPVGDAA